MIFSWFCHEITLFMSGCELAQSRFPFNLLVVVSFETSFTRKLRYIQNSDIYLLQLELVLSKLLDTIDV